MNTKLPTRPPHDERITVPLTAEDKRRIFETAAARGTTASDLMRRAVLALGAEPAPQQ